MTDYKVLFDAAGDEGKFKAKLQPMIQSVHRFIEPGSIDEMPTTLTRCSESPLQRGIQAKFIAPA